MDQVVDELVVSNIGDPSKELFHIRDRPRNFYMFGSMGLASSISLGIALSQEEKVVCIDGDGSILMNLGSLVTIASNKSGNLILVALDNGAYGTTGNQDSFTSGETDLGEIAKGCGFEATFKAETIEKLSSVAKQCLNTEGTSFIHVLIEADDNKFEPVPLDPIAIKSRFMMEIKGET